MNTEPTIKRYAPQPAHAPLYQKMLAFLAARSAPCDFLTLSVEFGAQVGGFDQAKNVRNRLEYLVEVGLVDADGVHTMRRYSRSSLPVPGLELHPAKPRQCFVNPPVGLPNAGRPKGRKNHVMPVAANPLAVPPRQHNVLLGTYVPPRGTSLRPGALDFAHLPSRGVSC